MALPKTLSIAELKKLNDNTRKSQQKLPTSPAPTTPKTGR